MNIGKIIVAFFIILIIFALFLYYQHNAGLGGQPKLSTTVVTIDGQNFTAEIAKTPLEQQMGLSGRSSLENNSAMIFIFNSSNRQSFWMKDMKFPLDIIFINNKKIVFIAQNQPPPKSATQAPPIIQPNMLSNAVLEINAGLSQQYHFKVGDTVKTPL